MWTVEIDEMAASDVRALPEDLKARLVQVIDLLVSEGPHDLPPQLVRHVDGKLWELRLKAKSGLRERSISLWIPGEPSSYRPSLRRRKSCRALSWNGLSTG
jgi:Phage derived protein Gp49-like (DUF891)